MSDPVYMTGPKGRTVRITRPEKISQALEMGFRPATEQEAQAREAADSPMRAGFEGAARGATLGISDFLQADTLRRLGVEANPEAGLLARKEANPAAALGGEVAGTLAASLIPGTGPSLAAKAGGLAERLAGGGLAGRVLGGAAEGSIYGLGSVISESSLGETQSTAEKAAAIAGGGIFGAGLGALAHGVGKAGETALAKTVGGSTLKDMLDGVPERLLDMQIGSKKVARAGGLDHEGVMQTMKYALDNKLLPKDYSAETFLNNVSAHKEKVGAGIQEALGGDAQALFDSDKLAARTERELLQHLRKDPGAKGDVAWIEEHLSELQGRGTFDSLSEMKSQLDDLRATQARQQKISELQAKVRQVGRDEAHAGEMDTLKARIDSLTKDQELGVELSTLQQQLRVIQQQARESGQSAAAADKIEGLQTRIKSVQRESARAGEIDLLRQKLGDLKGSKMPSEQVAHEVRTMERRIADLEDERVVERVGRMEGGIEDAAKQDPDNRAAVEDIKAQMRSFKGERSAQKFQALQQQLDDLAKKGPGGPSVVDDLRAQINKLRKAPQNARIKALQQNMLDEIQSAAPPRTLEDIHSIQSRMKARLGYQEAPASKEAKLKFRNIMRDELLSQLDARTAGSGAKYREATGNYRHASNLERYAEEVVSKADSNSPIAMRDMLFAAMGLSHGNVAAIGGLVASKMARERGGFFLAAMANKLAEGGTIPSIAGALKGKIDFMLENTPELLKGFRGVLAEASAKGAESLLATHVKLAQADPMYLPALGLQHEDSAASDQYAAKAEGLGVLHNAVGGVDNEIDAATARFLGKAPGRSPSATARLQPSLGDFRARVTRLEHIVRTPGVVDASAMAGVAPQLAMALTQQAHLAAQFLYDKAPKTPEYGKLPVLQNAWEPPKSELAKWYRYAGAVENPVAVLHDVTRDGTISTEAREALQAVYPRLWEQMRSKMMERLGQWHEPIGFRKKAALASVFGAEAMGENPQLGVLLQQMHSANMQPAQSPQGGPRSDGRQRVSQQENMETQAQRIESRGAR